MDVSQATISPDTMSAIKQAFPSATDQEINEIYPQIRSKLSDAGFKDVPDSELIALTRHIIDRTTSTDPDVLKQNDLAHTAYLKTMSETNGDTGQAALNTFKTMRQIPGFQTVQDQFGPTINKIHDEFLTDPKVQDQSGAAQNAAINDAPQIAQSVGALAPDTSTMGAGPAAPAVNTGQPVEAQLKAPPAGSNIDVQSMIKQLADPINKAYGDYNKGVKEMSTGKAISGLGAAIAGIYNPERIAQNDAYWQQQRAELLKTTVGAAKDQMEATLKAITAAGQIQDLTQKAALFPEQFKGAQIANMKGQLEVQALGIDMAQKMRDEAFRQKMDDPNSPETVAIKKSMDAIRKQAGIPDSVYNQWNGTAAAAFLHSYEPIDKMQTEHKKTAVEEMNAITNRAHIGLGYAQIAAQDRATAATNALAGAQLGATLQEKAAGDIDKHQTEVTAAQSRIDALKKAQSDTDASLGLLTGFKHQNGVPVTDPKTGARVPYTMLDQNGRPITPGPIQTGPAMGSDTLWNLRKRAPGGGALDELDKLMSSNTMANFAGTKGIRNQKEFDSLAKAGLSRGADTVANVNTLRRASQVIQNELNTQQGQLGTTSGLLQDARTRYQAPTDIGSKIGNVAPQRGPAAVGAGVSTTTIQPSAGAMGQGQNLVPRVTKDGRTALFDANTKQFVRYQ